MGLKDFPRDHGHDAAGVSGLAIADGYVPTSSSASTFSRAVWSPKRWACPAIRSGSARGQHRSRK